MTNPINPVRVRFAPSPTGHTHLGSARTALYDYLIARKTGGQFILRIEDTDQKRYVPGAETELMAGLRWLGMDWDEGPDVGGDFGPYRQSERREIYTHYARQLVDTGNAYYCFCTPERMEKVHQEQQSRKEMPHYDGFCRNLDLNEAQKRADSGERHVIRFKTPKEGATTGQDLLRGDITVENRAIDDYVLVRSDGLPVYHLAAMVDDHLMKITHVIRGSEWLSTFPLHVLIHRAFGWEEPVWVHLSVFLKPSGKGKMSKRESAELIKDGHSIFIKELQGLGYTPEGVINWIALMGWSFDDHSEFFTLADLVEKFSLDRLNPAPAAINFSKLDHFNGLHIRSLEISDLAKRVEPFFKEAGYQAELSNLEKIVPVIRERMVTLDDAPAVGGLFFEESIHPMYDDLIGKNMSKEDSILILRRTLAIIDGLTEITPLLAEPPMRSFIEELGLTPGQVFGILRVAVTGKTISPPLFESMEIFGKEKTIARLKQAISILETQE
jgi:glutamyl-tRNA synthetase